MSAFSQSKMKIELLNNIFTDKLSDGLHNNEEIGVIKTGYGSLYYLISPFPVACLTSLSDISVMAGL